MKRKKTVDIKKMVKELEKSSAYKLAYKDLDFLDRDYLRPLRLQLELLKPEMILRSHEIESTIVVFGGTRIIAPTKAKSEVRKAKRKLEREPNDRLLKRKLRIAKSVEAKSKYYDEAREFGRLVSSECLLGNRSEFVIATGGGPGIMEAANRGAFDSDAKTIGLNITLPFEQEPNAYITPELCLKFHYFAIRKMHFMLRAKALVAFPGGYGTLDELFEALTLVQTSKVEPLPIVLFGEKFWKGLLDFDYLVDEGVISPKDVKLFVYADTAVDAWNYIKYFFRAAENGTSL